VVFGVKLSNEDTAEIEGLRDVAMATNFGIKIVIIGFGGQMTTRQLLMEGSLSGQLTEYR